MSDPSACTKDYCDWLQLAPVVNRFGWNTTNYMQMYFAPNEDLLRIRNADQLSPQSNKTAVRRWALFPSPSLPMRPSPTTLSCKHRWVINPLLQGAKIRHVKSNDYYTAQLRRPDLCRNSHHQQKRDVPSDITKQNVHQDFATLQESRVFSFQ